MRVLVTMSQITAERANARFAVGNVALHLVDVNLTNDLLVRRSVHMNRHNVFRDGLRRSKKTSKSEIREQTTHAIPLLIVLVLDDEDHVESRQNSRLKVDVLARTLHVVVTTKDGIGGGHDRCTRVENGRDTGFGDRDRLLFHRFVNRYSIFVPHLVEFVDADHTAVGEDHGPAFEVELASLRISLDRSGETSCRRAFAGRVDRDGRNFLDELEQLRLGGTGIAEEEDVDVAS